MIVAAMDECAHSLVFCLLYHTSIENVCSFGTSVTNDPSD